MMSNQAINIEKLDIGIENQGLEDSIEQTSKVLASTYALYLKTQYYHWNVVGAEFYNLHIMFEEQYKELREAVDDVAERIRTLGGVAPGTFSEFLKLSFLKEDEKSPSSWHDMVSNLQEDHEKLAKELRNIIEGLQNNKDEGSADMFTQRMKYHEKTAWMLRSLTKNKDSQ
ncbi:DNA starvation/stationary phase protection protein [Rickettsiales bacterium]|nr:DNA starvation/stationary phase protection protein [Rickettsiales bacterium]